MVRDPKCLTRFETNNGPDMRMGAGARIDTVRIDILMPFRFSNFFFGFDPSRTQRLLSVLFLLVQFFLAFFSILGGSNGVRNWKLRGKRIVEFLLKRFDPLHCSIASLSNTINCECDSSSSFGLSVVSDVASILPY